MQQQTIISHAILLCNWMSIAASDCNYCVICNAANVLTQLRIALMHCDWRSSWNIAQFIRFEYVHLQKTGSTSTLYMMLREIRKKKESNRKVTLLEVGEVIEKLMGGAYRSRYCRRKFRSLYYQVTRNKYSVSQWHFDGILKLWHNCGL